MAELRAPLPDAVSWLTADVEALVRPGAFLLSTGSTEVAAYGASRVGGHPDIPFGLGWPPVGPWRYQQWADSPYDGEAFCFQLNLETIPDEVRQPHWPTEGMVWVFIDLKNDWSTRVETHLGPVSNIKWQPRPAGVAPVARKWVLQDTLSFCSEEVLPSIFWADDLCQSFDEWVADTYYSGPQDPDALAMGPWLTPIQGDQDIERKTLVCALEGQSFGDSGAVYLHYSKEQGFYAEVTCC